MVDLGFYMVTLMTILDKADATSYEICNPLSYVIVNDRDGMYVVWEQLQSVFPISSLPHSNFITLEYKVNELIFPSDCNIDYTKVFLCYLVALACNCFEKFRGQ